ncbi:MAG: hypothetical protein HY852_18900 [Bradyrhizobium sp.]|uniref:COG4223 family protein n=1 Tax=Bradyrhizobium sp. TaxID=376 RepID=UPI0025C1417F|nr:hypothetical protein [Bradyrhizobium sp.]MBI5263882.1 hypothetical protein [Bradyrhizobium sp.]
MVDDTPEDSGPAPDAGRPKRTPPTIDLEAAEVSTAPQAPTGEANSEPKPAPEPAKPEAGPERAQDTASISPSISPWVIAPFSGAVAASVVIAVGWMLGWPAVQAPPPPPQVSAASVDALAGRVASLEAKTSKPAAPVPDPATTARVDALEKTISALRNDVTGLRAQSEKLAGLLSEVKSAPRDAAAAGPDLSALEERTAQLERAGRAERAEIAQQGEKIAEAKSVDDMPLRRVVAAALLDVAVRHGEAYASLLSAAKSLAPDPELLKPLDEFATSGVPNPAALSRELLNVVPKLSPPAETQGGGTGVVDRLQAGASKLVRIERTDGVGNGRGAIVARITAAALRNDMAEARRELKTLEPADRAPAQAWLAKTDARDAALAASRKFADETMADLAKSAQQKSAQ